MKKITKEKTQSPDAIYNDEINKLKEEKKNLNEELENTKNGMDELKEKNKSLEEELKLMKDLKNDIDNYKKDKEQTFEKLKSNNEIYEKKIEEITKEKNEMEINLSTFKIELNMKEDEMFYILNVLKSMIEKNKRTFELGLKRLPDDIKKEFIELNKKHKFIK